MLDLIISYINFLILSIGYIVKRFTFFPPDPPHYKSISTNQEDEENILFLIISKSKKVKKYMSIQFRLLDYGFIKLIDKDKNALPLLVFYPPSNIPVCIIYSHGNSGDLGSCLLEYYDIAVNTNCIVVSFEYPGYGECKNQPSSESQFFKNLKMTYIFVKKCLGFKPNQIILYGFSLGTGIIFNLACQQKYHAAGLILQSPFLSIFRILYDVNTTRYFDLFNNCDKAKHLCLKTLFIHGNKDTIIPYIHGRILSKLIPQEYFYDFLTVDNAGHNNIFKVNKELIYKKIRQFIKDCTGQSSDFIKKAIDKENHPIDDFEINKKESSSNFENSNNNKSNKIDNNKLNKSDEIKRPQTSLIITKSNYPLLNLNPLYNNKMEMMINNTSNFTNNLFKCSYPLNSNQNNFQNNYYNQINSQIFNKNKNLNNNQIPYFKKLYISNPNIESKNFSSTNQNEQYINNSIFKSLNDSK